MPTFQLNEEVYLDKCEKCYKKIITINKIPNEPKLNSIIKIIRREKLSPFDVKSNCECISPCLFAILNPENKRDLLCLDNIGDLFCFLINNGYKIEDKITKFMSKKQRNLICFISTTT